MSFLISEGYFFLYPANELKGNTVTSDYDIGSCVTWYFLRNCSVALRTSVNFREVRIKTFPTLVL